MMLKFPSQVQVADVISSVNRHFGYGSSYTTSRGIKGLEGSQVRPLFTVEHGLDIQYVMVVHDFDDRVNPKIGSSFQLVGSQITPEIIEQVQRELSGKR